jgi:hypothetical protein
MGSYRQTFLDHLPTLVTFLTGETRGHSHHLMTSSCSLIFKDVEEGAPRGVENALRQMMIFHHVGDLKVFHSNGVILFSIPFGHLEMVISALPVDLQVCLGDVPGGFTASVAALLAPAQLPLLASECLLRRAIETRVRNGMAFAIGKEDLEPDINPDVRMLTATWGVLSLWFRLTNDQRVPMSIGSLHEVYRLGCSLDLPMQLDLEEVPKLLRHHEMFFILMQIAVFAVLSELDGVPPIRLFEAGETDTGDVVLFGGEKPFEGLGEAISQHLYRCGWYVLPLPFECRLKLILALECPILLILCLDRLKHAIVNGARLSQARLELARLLFIHEQAVLKGSHEHILLGAVRKAKRQGNTPPKPQRRNAFFTSAAHARGTHRRFLVVFC